MASAAPISAFTRITQIAAGRQVHQAFQWLHLQAQQILRWQTEMVAVPAPPFGERKRAEWLCERFREAGLADVALDEAGNAIGRLVAKQPCEHIILLSAHIDTVFPEGTIIEPRVEGTRLHAPGACDNAAGVVCLLALATAFRQASLVPECDIYFVGNVGEEGEGNLRGVRQIYDHAKWQHRIGAHIVLDGAGHEVAVTQALGSQRFLVTVRGPGGHSWTDSGRPNPIVALSQAISRLAELDLSGQPRTTWNAGTIEGGTSVNAIPETASARFDFRSTDPEQLIRLEVELHRAVEDAVLAANSNPNGATRRPSTLSFTVENIGSRPAGHLDGDSPLLDALLAVDRHLGIRTERRVASTDANIPLSRGVSAVSLGAGGEGGGIHTRNEWYDARGRELGLRRVLLLVLAAAAAQAS